MTRPDRSGEADVDVGHPDGVNSPDDVSDVHRFPPKPDVSMPTAVAEAVASVLGVNTTDLDPIYDAGIDPDALDALFQGGDGEIRFRYAGLSVTVTDVGEVVVDGTR